MPIEKSDHITKDYLRGALDQLAKTIVQDVVDQVEKRSEPFFVAIHQDILANKEDISVLKEGVMGIKEQMVTKKNHDEVIYELSQIKNIQSVEVKRADHHSVVLNNHQFRITRLEHTDTT